MHKGICKHIRVGAWCLVTLFVTYYAAISLFAHVHVVNGVLIVHSHPFSHAHSHSGEHALALHFLSTFSSLEPEHADTDFSARFLLRVLPYQTYTSPSVRDCTEGMYLRAPPLLSFS